MITLSHVIASCDRWAHAQNARIAKAAIQHSLELAKMQPGETLEMTDFCARTGIPLAIVAPYYTYVAHTINGQYKIGTP